MNEVVRSRWASAKFNNDFFRIETYSGYSSPIRDPLGVQHLLQPDASDQELGSALLDALAHSRFVLGVPRNDVRVHPEVTYDMSLYDYELSRQRYAEWIRKLMERFGYM
ncbi:contact-dependent growth inhibition system immunity protein [Pannonibacter phragmitetus]|uniref:contact-dependent growth inhibition system immunity protein n=1 Tax=Pannonibacter phragmitetus TaxID=121719 RepID=UPI0009EA7AA1|nr:contact-dependent growth inhibition system immunity protein [Pannonibacter phragmitetus]